jgi:hypothetical protein
MAVNDFVGLLSLPLRVDRNRALEGLRRKEWI